MENDISNPKYNIPCDIYLYHKYLWGNEIIDIFNPLQKYVLGQVGSKFRVCLHTYIFIVTSAPDRLSNVNNNPV